MSKAMSIRHVFRLNGRRCPELGPAELQVRRTDQGLRITTGCVLFK
jgi:hypothetical protein